MSYKTYNINQTNNKQAVALGYDAAQDSAPKVIANGKGLVAEQIIDMAKKHNIPIKNDKALMQLLSALEIDALIPLEAYEIVAEILYNIYKANNSVSQKDEGG
ncbi:MAG: EscU/YscU/HrcU family type III secretion system export apparatus switch protein [Rickettsiaceae bacterium]|nr:EscU/YscU/HrcU family type III secretion system export apparatus switch protein [Rickettsiaceae bacterium]